MNGVFDFIPTFCPNCGSDLYIKDNKYARQDFFAGASFTCDCGFHFGYKADSEKEIEDESES